jgi:Flp pilus assembly protein TadD
MTSMRLVSRPSSIAVILVLGSLLYYPYFGNAIVFDDFNFFRGSFPSIAATTPWAYPLRGLPYFTLGFVEVVWGTLWAHRVTSLVLHLSSAVLLCFAVRELTRLALAQASSDDQGDAQHRATVGGLVAGTLFVVHPSAVYGAGYLIQRSIVLATLFSLASMLFLNRALVRRRVGDTVSATLFFALSVFSKEHAILFPFAACAALLILWRMRRADIKLLALFLAQCVPVMVLVVLLKAELIGHAYEPVVADVLAQMDIDESKLGWPLSAATQIGLFFKYVYLWMIPDVRMMSADMKVDFLATWSPAWIAVKLFAFVAWPTIAVGLSRKGGLRALFGAGMIYAWILFLVEISSIRFQEPFVLYRSYLWAPGFLLMATAAIGSLQPRIALLAYAALAVTLLLLATDRLATLATPLDLWNDAAVKLEERRPPGADRIFYNRGIELMRQGFSVPGLQDLDKAVALAPGNAGHYWGRGRAYLATGDVERALADLGRAVALRPDVAMFHYHHGIAQKRRGNGTEAAQAFRKALELGYPAAKIALDALDKESPRQEAPQR